MSVSQNKAQEIARQMLNELYQNAKPKTTWKKYLKLYEGTKIRGFEKHYLEQRKSERILEKYKKKVGRKWGSSLGMIWLDYCPTSNSEGIVKLQEKT